MTRGNWETMSVVETRSSSRESLFMFADVQLGQRAHRYRVRVRNLSSNGMMGAGNLRVERGAQLTVFLEGEEPIEGHVAWVQGDRFGIAFSEEIDFTEVKQHNTHRTGSGSMESAIVPRRSSVSAPDKLRPI
ncbi:MAG: PilZ domain-containing protein [Alphaproteobacteria bacterium]|nr:MAG: PilZ domain-containing protein [Alphaproteobacteria bacterium]